MLCYYLPKTLKTLSRFEDTNVDIDGASLGPSSRHQSPTRDLEPLLGTALAGISFKLQNLSASFMVDARQFFQAARTDKVWEHLESLTLSSPLLVPTCPPGKANDMLLAAGLAAMRMPKLRMMEIWNGGRGYAALFRYHIHSLHLYACFGRQLGPGVATSCDSGLDQRCAEVYRFRARNSCKLSR